MKTCNTIIKCVDYGQIVYDIKPLMKKRKLNKNQIIKMTGLHHQIIERYTNNSIARFDRQVLAKLCYVLDCKLEDIIYYVKPEE